MVAPISGEWHCSRACLEVYVSETIGMTTVHDDAALRLQFTLYGRLAPIGLSIWGYYDCQGDLTLFEVTSDCVSMGLCLIVRLYRLRSVNL
jgi:hypothetical protein